MATPQWQSGTLYQPGDLVRPLAAQPVDVGQPDNPGFETGTTADWTVFAMVGGSGTFTAQSTHKLAGTYAAKWNGGIGGGPGGGIQGDMVNNDRAAVTPGQAITGKCFILYNTFGQVVGSAGGVRIYWFDAANTFLSFTEGNAIVGSGNNGHWVQSTVYGVAPPGAAFAAMGVSMTVRTGDIYVDEFSWNYAYSGVPDNLIFRAVQADAGYSAATEPTWPNTAGLTVVDNEVTWEAVEASRVVWEATPILVSGPTEPTFPGVGGTVVDNTIAWVGISRRIDDDKCPQSKQVVLGASKIYAADEDIIRYCATVNPLDWHTIDDAGYIPFGLQNYGSQPVMAMGLYRSNLVAFSGEGSQMWQIDQDPANNALLDAVPIASVEHAAGQPVANDFILLNPTGIRNYTIAGASTNLQADGIGEPIDELVLPKMQAGTFVPFGLFYPGAGQYWVVFGSEAFVLTINGAKRKSWSRYTFPEALTDWTILNTKLYLRTVTHKVWEFDPQALYDDMVGEAGVDIVGLVQWPHLDFGSPQDKSLFGFDLICNAPNNVLVSIGYDQRNLANRTAPYEVDPDTLPGPPVAMPVTAPSFDLQLTFPAGQKWEWFQANLYLQDRSK